VWWLCVTLSLCATKVTHWSGAVRESLSIMMQVYGHAAANALRQMQVPARKVEGADNQQVQMSREIVKLPIGWKHSQRTGAVKGFSVYNSQPLSQYLRPGIFAEALPVKLQPYPD
jgi:hypothetical protein